MSQKSFSKFFILTLIAFFTVAYAKADINITGQVLTVEEEPIREAYVALIDEYGEKILAKTDEKGFYSFEGLMPGEYTIYIENLLGYIIERPYCGNYNVYVEQSSHYVFYARSTGVIIEYGSPGTDTPTGGGGSSSGNGNGKLFLPSEDFEFSIYASYLWLYEPDRISVTGHWTVPGKGKIDVNTIDGYPAGPYVGSGMNVNFSNSGYGKVTLDMEYSPLNMDGEIATYRFRVAPWSLFKIYKAKGQLAFCIDSLTLYRKGEEVFSTSDNWVGNYFDLRVKK